MPFLQADFNKRNRDTGIRAMTRHERSTRGCAPAELRVFQCGDFFWLGDHFLSWGDYVYFRNFFHVGSSWGLPQSRLDEPHPLVPA